MYSSKEDINKYSTSYIPEHSEGSRSGYLHHEIDRFRHKNRRGKAQMLIQKQYDFGDEKQTQQALHYLVNISDKLQTLNGTLEQMRHENDSLK